MRDGAIGATARATNTEGGTGREVAMRDGAIGATGSAAAVLALLALLWQQELPLRDFRPSDTSFWKTAPASRPYK